MAWTAPRTWVAAETVTAALLNLHVRDNLKAIGDAWTAYTPVWTGASTNPVVNNGTITGAYMTAGKLVHFRFVITMGTTTTYGTGQYRVTLPPVTPASQIWAFNGALRDDSVPARWTFSALWTTSGYVELFAPAATAGIADRAFTGTVPITLANLDSISVNGTYEAA